MTDILNANIVDENDMIIEDEINYIPVEEKSLRERIKLFRVVTLDPRFCDLRYGSFLSLKTYKPNI